MAERNLDFDRVIDRRDTKCLKYDFDAVRGYPEGILPLWVADMDFATSSYIEDALKGLAEHNIYGYSNIRPGDGFFEAVAGWMKRHHDWEVRREWHITTPGVCFAIANAIRAVTEKDDAVIIQQPVYYPFNSIILKQGRKPIVSQLVVKDGFYTVDMEDFERKIVENDVKLFILCNPHNPVGRVWKRGELLEMGNVCKKHGVKVFSDEIHADFVWKGEFNIFQEVDPSFRDFTITATAPSKTFNLAGLQQSNIFIPDPGLYRSFRRAYYASGLDEPNIAGITAAQAAYEHGDTWYEGMKAYVRDNIDMAVDFVNDRMHGVKVGYPEGTYLIWLDFTELGLNDDELDDLIINKAGLWLDAGHIFGQGGSGHQRINVACPRSTLDEALTRIERALNSSPPLRIPPETLSRSGNVPRS